MPIQSLPVVTYPEGSIDISLAVANLCNGANDATAQAYNALRGVETNRVLVLYQHSDTHESLLTTRGRIALADATMSWWLGDKETSILSLWEQFPRLRSYLRSRTERYIAYKLDEMELLADHVSPNERERTENHLAVLQRDLDLLPAA